MFLKDYLLLHYKQYYKLVLTPGLQPRMCLRQECTQKEPACHLAPSTPPALSVLDRVTGRLTWHICWKVCDPPAMAHEGGDVCHPKLSQLTPGELRARANARVARLEFHTCAPSCGIRTGSLVP